MTFPEVNTRIFSSLFVCSAALVLSACGGGGGGGGGGPVGSDPSITYVKGSFVDFRIVDGDKVGLGCLSDGDNPNKGCDQFGSAVALSDDGTVMVVGSPFEDSDGNLESDNSIDDAGAAYVFVRSAGEWSQQQYLKAENPGVKDLFGSAVAISGDGNTLAVGAFGEDGGADGINGNQLDDSELSAGAVYVFTRSGDNWTQQAYIKSSESAANHQFGIALALNQNGSRLAVGAAGNEAVYTFDLQANAWSQQSKLQASNGEAGDEFGIAVSLNGEGTILAVGAWLEDGNGVDEANNSVGDSGAVYVFARSGDTWAAPEYLKASPGNVDAGDAFGRALDINDTGDLLAVGAPGENEDRGRVYVVADTGNSWEEDEILSASNADPGDAFGSAVALAAQSGDLIYVGARGEDSPCRARDLPECDKFDNGVCEDCPNIPYNEFDSGAVYEFSFKDNMWQEGDYIKASNAGGGDKFGSALAVSADSSADGFVFAVGAPLEDGPSTGINQPQLNAKETQAGAIYIYDRGQ
ncbi:MAG: hypothetical protein P8Y61_02715 [Gammaproteobacteria bacterium]|jgi:hypothetical protein